MHRKVCTRRACVFATLIAAVTSFVPSSNAQIAATNDGFTVQTRSVELTVSQGAITRLLNRASGELHTATNAPTAWIPRGMIAASDMQPVAVLHNQWSSHEIYPGGLATSIATLDRGPGPTSRMTTTTLPGGGLRCTWTGLTDGVRTYANDALTIEATIDTASGIVDLTAEATTSEGSVVGVIVPLQALHPRHTILVPSFGGLAYPATDLAKKRMYTLGGAPYNEAPIIVAEGERGSVALWVEDKTFRSTFTFFGGDGNGCALGIEAVNDMPFEGQMTSRRATWRIGGFSGAWPNAVAPYRNWYTTTFSAEIERRKSISWASDIAVIVDRLGNEANALSRLAKVLDPTKVLLHEWNPRTADFDTALPDWTPKPNFVRNVSKAKELQFRSMGYVNSYCVNFNSPVFLRDRISQFALPRKIAGIGSYTAPAKTFQSSQANEILYLDPLSPEWRRYHVDAMIKWRRATGVDAAYEDTGGTGGDYGNGEVAGLRGAQGAWAQFKEMLERNPVAMATEYAPDNIAFASTWALRYVQTWGTPELRKQWETRLRPMTPALFGGAGRAWVPSIVAEDERTKFSVTGCSDALGGVAQLEATATTFEAKSGMARHLLERAQLFDEFELKPTFEGWPKDPSVAALYRDKDGKTHTYRAREGLHELVGPSGTPHYQRITGLTNFESPLAIAGWPASAGTRHFALNPAAPYALTSNPVSATAVRLERVPSGCSISRYVETPTHVLVAFAGTGTAGEMLRLRAQSDFTDVIVGDRKGKAIRRAAPLRNGDAADFRLSDVSYALLLRTALQPAKLSMPLASTVSNGRFISDATGLERGGEYAPPNQKSLRLSGSSVAQNFRFVSHGGDSEIAFDYLISVPSPDSAIEVAVRNTQTRYGNGSTVRCYVNGVLARAERIGINRDTNSTTTPDTNARVIRIPVGANSGRPIVFSVGIWGNGDDNADEVWMSEPRLVRDAARTASVRTVAVVGE